MIRTDEPTDTDPLAHLLEAGVWDTRELLDVIESYAYGVEAPALDRALRLADLIEPYADDFQYGATVIADDYFVEFAQELAHDIGAVDSEARWPQSCVDWTKAARELQWDYCSFEFEGRKWWVR